MEVFVLPVVVLIIACWVNHGLRLKNSRLEKDNGVLSSIIREANIAGKAPEDLE